MYQKRKKCSNIDESKVRKNLENSMWMFIKAGALIEKKCYVFSRSSVLMPRWKNDQHINLKFPLVFWNK